MSVLALPTLLLLACTSTTANERCAILGDRLDLPLVRQALVCNNTCIDTCKVQAFQERMCSALNPHWTSERRTRRGCKKYTNSFDEMKGHSIKGHNNQHYNAILSKCKSLCIHAREFVCVSFDYRGDKVRNDDNCFLSSYGYMDVPEKDRESGSPEWSLFARKCLKF